MSSISPEKTDTGPHNIAYRWQLFAVAIILALAMPGAYWNSFNVPFLLDDECAIAGNPSIRHLGQIGDVLSPSIAGTTAGRPLLNFTFALNYALGGLSLRGYHIFNLLIHLCAGLALLGVVRRTLLLPCLKPRYGEAAVPLAACVVFLWALHPLQTESVTYISQRAESVMGLFYLLTLYGFIRSAGGNLTEDSKGNEASELENRSSFPSVKTSGSSGLGIGWLILSVAACFCGMGTKQSMITAPVLVLLYDRVFVSGSFRKALVNRPWYYAGLAASWLFLGFLMHQSSLAVVNVGFESGVNWLTYALTELRVVVSYLKLAIWPHPLVFDYDPDVLVKEPLTVVPYALIIVAILIGIAIAWRRSPMVGFLGCWVFLILSPTSTVVPITAQPMAESRMYLPLAAIAASVVFLAFRFIRRRALVVLGLIVLICGALTIRRNHDYRSEMSIWEDTVIKQPHAFRAHSNLANALAMEPEGTPRAIVHYEEALRLKPSDPEAHYNLATGLAKMPGRLPDAIAHYEEALRLNPNYATAHNNLATELAKIPGRWPDAIAHYEEALRLNPDYATAHNNLAMELAKIPGRLPDAIRHYEEALRIKPTYAEAHYNLANALAKLPGRQSDAIGHYEEALRLNPAYAEAHNNLADALMQIPGRVPDAIAHYEEAIRLRPTYAELHTNFANSLAKLPGRQSDAITHYEEALRLNPAYAEAHNNLATAFAQMPGRLPDAIAHYEEAIRLRPAYAEAHSNLASVLAEIPGRLADAIAHSEEALRLNPRSAEVHYNLANILAGIPGRITDAIAHYQEAIRLKPEYADAHNNLAVCYAETGQLNAAIEQLEIVLRLAPDSAAIRDSLEKLKARQKQ